jgi:hypothetical protein
MNLELNHTYLLQFRISDILSSVTILLVTEKAYRIRWNIGKISNDTWELKKKIDDNYSMVEDVTDQLKDNTLHEVITKLNVETTWKNCPDCDGFGWIEDSNSTSGQRICSHCWGNKIIIDNISIK